MPLVEFQCKACGAASELLLRGADQPRCGACGSPDLQRLISSFSFKPARPAKYDEQFREKTLPFLKSRPGAEALFAQGGQSEEATAFQLSEAIGDRVDSVLDTL
ncbi:MAG TPA: zinc ribbon domain-containing protein [Chloroflexota bacterium]